MHKKKKESIYFEYLEIFLSLFMILLMTLIFIYSIIYWVDNFPYGNTIGAQYFYAGVGVAIITSVGQWISGRLKAINRNFYNITNTRRKNARKK